jgi:homoserine dehydrogenase
MKIIIVGYGNVGKALHKVLSDNNITVDLTVSNDGIFDANNLKLDSVSEFGNYVEKDTVVFISTPSYGVGEISSIYYIKSLENGASVVTCEKAFLANNWDFVNKYPSKIKYSATVGGNSGILGAIADFKGNINDVWAVVNGTLNYIGDKLDQGSTKEEIFKEVVEKGFAEPGARDFDEIIQSELNDVLYKTTILANHSKLYPSVVNPIDIFMNQYKDGLRCSVSINKDEIKAGFIEIKNVKDFPSGVNNVLYINGEKIIEGPGAGAQITAERMLKDYKELLRYL